MLIISRPAEAGSPGLLWGLPFTHTKRTLRAWEKRAKALQERMGLIKTTREKECKTDCQHLPSPSDTARLPLPEGMATTWKAKGVGCWGRGCGGGCPPAERHFVCSSAAGRRSEPLGVGWGSSQMADAQPTSLSQPLSGAQILLEKPCHPLIGGSRSFLPPAAFLFSPCHLDCLKMVSLKQIKVLYSADALVPAQARAEEGKEAAESDGVGCCYSPSLGRQLHSQST